jgi:hypothetical protein
MTSCVSLARARIRPTVTDDVAMVECGMQLAVLFRSRCQAVGSGVGSHSATGVISCGGVSASCADKPNHSVLFLSVIPQRKFRVKKIYSRGQ